MFRTVSTSSPQSGSGTDDRRLKTEDRTTTVDRQPKTEDLRWPAARSPQPVALALTALLSLAVPTVALGQPAPAPAAHVSAAPDFARDVLPVFEAHCLRCHSAAAQKGNLILDTHEDVMLGGRKGAALVPGHSDKSMLVGMIEGRVEPRMPPKGELAPDEISTVKAWIDAGAKDSPGASLSLDARLPAIRPLDTRLPPVSSLAFHPKTREILIPGYREIRRLPGALAAAGATPVRAPARASSSLAGAIDLVRSVAASPDGWWVAGAGGIPGAVGEVLIWDAETGALAHTLKGHRDYVYDAEFNRRSTRLATVSYDRTLRIWDLDTGRAIRVLREHTEAIYAVAFSPDDKWVATGSGDRAVKIWDVRSGRRLHTLTDATEPISSVAFHPSAMRVTAAGADKTIRTWTVTAKGGTQIAAVLAHGAPVLAIAYSPDGARLASSASDGVVKIWDTATWRETRTLERQPDWAQALAWSPDGRQLAVGRYDGSVLLYDARTGRRVRQVMTVAPAKPGASNAGRAATEPHAPAAQK